MAPLHCTLGSPPPHPAWGALCRTRRSATVYVLTQLGHSHLQLVLLQHMRSIAWRAHMWVAVQSPSLGPSVLVSNLPKHGPRSCIRTHATSGNHTAVPPPPPAEPQEAAIVIMKPHTRVMHWSRFERVRRLLAGCGALHNELPVGVVCTHNTQHPTPNTRQLRPHHTAAYNRPTPSPHHRAQMLGCMAERWGPWGGAPLLSQIKAR